MENNPVPLESGRALQLKEVAQKILANVGQVIVGKQDTCQLVLAALLCEGHVLLEDVPGVGKTLLAKALARSLGCSFQRVQCTADLLPSDVTGVQYFNQKEGRFEFRPGPIMSNFVLVDEINRATPRTQSSFLEAMQEQQITVDLQTLPLPRPFLLMATQNPIELEGTFPLPEAQLDRFLLRLRLGYPSPEEEGRILLRFQHDNPLERLEAVVSSSDLLQLQSLCRRVYVDRSVREYLLALVRATREQASLKLGASPRAALGLYQASQAVAAIQGRAYVSPDDVKRLAGPVLAHRLILKPEARLKGRSAEELVQGILAQMAVPVEDKK